MWPLFWSRTRHGSHSVLYSPYKMWDWTGFFNLHHFAKRTTPQRSLGFSVSNLLGKVSRNDCCQLQIDTDQAKIRMESVTPKFQVTHNSRFNRHKSFPLPSPYQLFAGGNQSVCMSDKYVNRSFGTSDKHSSLWNKVSCNFEIEQYQPSQAWWCILSFLKKEYLVCVYVCVCWGQLYGTLVVWLVGNQFPQTMWVWGSNSGCQAWWDALSHWVMSPACGVVPGKPLFKSLPRSACQKASAGGSILAAWFPFLFSYPHFLS